MNEGTPGLTQAATFRIYIERTGKGIAWWADTEAVPGLSVAAPTLRELRTLIDEATRLHLGESTAVSLELIVNEQEPEQAPVTTSEILPSLPVGAEIRSTLFAA